MLEVYDKVGNLKQLSEKEDVDLKLNKNCSMIRELPVSYSDTSMFFQVDKEIIHEGVSIPVFSRGIFIGNGNSNDLVMIAIDPLKNLYIGFRNNGKWTSIRKI